MTPLYPTRSPEHSIPTTGMRGGLGRTLLTAFLLLAIGPLSLVGYVTWGQVRGDRQRGAAERLASVADLGEAQMRQWIYTRASSLTMLSNDPAVVSDLASWRAGDGPALRNVLERSKHIVESDGAFREIFWVAEGDEEKWVSATTGARVPLPAWAVSPRDLAAPRLCRASDGTPIFELAAPVRDATDQRLGFVVGEAQFTLETFTNLGLGRTGVVYVMNRERQALALHSGLPVSWLSDLAHPGGNTGAGETVSPGATRALGGQNGVATYENPAGAAVMGAYRWLDDLQLALVVEQEQAEAFGSSDELAAGLIGAVLGVALLTAIIAAGVTRQITRPIVLLTEAALKMSGGDLTVRVQPVAGQMRRDEIGILSNVFNTMASELADLYTGLERKVAERTHELQEAKEQIQYHAWQLAISAEIGRITTSILDLDTLLERASQLMRDAFQLERVAVYVLDRSGEIAVLQKTAGRGVPPHERQLRVGGAHPVSWAISQRMSRTVTQPCGNGDSKCYELVLPLALGAHTIGAIDLTSRDPDGFSELDRSVLQALADQLTVAIQNARAYSQEHEAADEMREIDRLRGQFLMRMSHQLATYLNTILGFSQVMLKGLDGPLTELQSKDVSAIRRSGQQLAQLLNDILELANLEVGAVEMHYAPVDLAALIAELQTTLASTLVNPQLHLDMQSGPDLPVMMADADRLRQVLANLVITATEMSHEGAIILRVTPSEDRVQFVVSAPTRWASAEGNHGISLALSRRLVELHGGRLRVAEGHQDTTVFEFTLPVNAGPAPGTERASPCAASGGQDTP